jgi:hypothetical protein
MMALIFDALLMNNKAGLREEFGENKANAMLPGPIP